MSGVVWLFVTFTVPETYAPTILARRARKLREETGQKDWVTEQDLDMRPLSERLAIFLVRPFQLLFRELIVFLVSVYMSVLYGLLYMFFIAYPVVFQKGKGYNAGTTGLMFIPIAVGVCAVPPLPVGVVRATANRQQVVCSALCAPLVNRHYIKLLKRLNGATPPPEYRLIPMMFACWFIPIGLFIFAWTSYTRLIWVGPCLAGFPVGFGFIFIYNSANNYLVDSYQHQAASALAAKTFLRSLWGAGVVLFTLQMYDRLGDQWASSLLAFISLACCIIPFLFWRYGARIRARSRYAYSPMDEHESASGSDLEKAKQSRNGGVVDPHETEEGIRRAVSYVSNP